MQASVSRRFFVRTTGAFALAGGLAADSVIAAMSKTSLPEVDLGFLPVKLPFKRRSGWTKQVPKPWILKPSAGFDRITVHHTATDFDKSAAPENVMAAIEAICSEHKIRGYGDIGYHFVIDPAGMVWEARSLAYEGAHVAGQNDLNLGIVLLGNYEVQVLSDRQREVLSTLITVVRDRFQIKRHRIYGHCDLGRSLCPGRNLYSVVQYLKKPDKAD